MKTPYRFHPDRSSARLAILMLAAALPVSAQVQMRVVEIAPGQVAPAGNVPEVVPAAPAPAEVKPELPDLAKALLTMKFDRSPEALLAATRANRKGGELSPEEAFKMSVMFGDWAAVGKALAALPQESATAGYAKLLEAIAEQAIPVGMVLKAPEQDSEDVDPFEERNRLQNERNQLKRIFVRRIFLL